MWSTALWNSDRAAKRLAGPFSGPLFVLYGANCSAFQ